MGEAQARARIPLIDELRGICVVGMVIYHALYDLTQNFAVPVPFFEASWMGFVQQLGACVFIFLAGVACRLSRSNLRRGLWCLGVAAGITLVTAVLFPDFTVYFGIMHFMGTAMVLFALLRRALDRLPVWAGFGAFLLIFALTWRLPGGMLGLPGLGVALPRSLYSSPLLAPLGFPPAGFGGFDYFPLLPYLPLFIAGSFFGVPYRERRMPAPFYHSFVPVFGAAGRHALAIYVLHQPIVYGALTALRWAGVL